MCASLLLECFLIFILVATIAFARPENEEAGRHTCECSPENFDADLSSGIFKSPMFPTNYCDDLDCVYEIEPKRGFAIGLVVEYFDMEPQHDYVEVYQMFFNESAGYQYVKQYVLTGHTISQRHFYSAIGGGIRLVFVTDSSDSDYSGFQMSFYRFDEHSRRHSPCPFPFHFAKTESQMLPTLAHHFSTDSLCAFLINSTDAVGVVVHSLSANMKLKIYETENFLSKRRADVLESLNGFATLDLPHIITSRTGSLTIVVSFSATHAVSRSNILDSSYHIEYQNTQSVCNCPAASIQVDYEAPKSLLSPGFPLEYCDFANCSTSISVAPHNQPRNISVSPVIRVKLESFRLEMDVDFLEMIDGQRSLVGLTDNAKDISYFTFDHSTATLRFVTDHSVTEPGFNLTLDVYQKPYYCECPGTPQILQEMKYSQNFTFEEECRFMDCFWEIRLPSLLLNGKFEADTEFIELSNGENLERNTERLRLDASMVPDNESAERSIEFEDLEFVSVWYHRDGDMLPSARYLHIEYEWRQKCLCGNGVLRAELDEWQQLTSPDYPMAYCNRLNCQYRIEFQPDVGSKAVDYRIVLNVTDFFTEINRDFLMIFEGNSTTGRRIEMLSGIALFTSVIKSERNVMTLLFITDMSLSMRGFALWYKAEKINQPRLDLSDEEIESLMSSRQANSTAHHSRIAYFIILLLLTIIIALLGYVVRLSYFASYEWLPHTVRYRSWN